MNEKNNTHISACIVVYNEEQLIERCLKSVYGFCDEIIVIHDGECQDNTLTIARKYTDLIYTRPHAGEAEIHRADAYSRAKGEWILSIDADEFISDASIKIIKDTINSQNDFNCLSLIWPIWNGEKYITSKWPYKPCLFRKSKIHYIAFPHSEALADGKNGKIPARLEHQPKYCNLSWKSFRSKQKKWINIHAEYLTRDIYDFDSFNVSGERKWPLHMNMIIKLKLLSIPINIIIFLLSYIRQKEVYYTPITAFRQLLLCCGYYACVAIEYNRLTPKRGKSQ
jgi:glycosyltransferase involved in cell wall biosynthesis